MMVQKNTALRMRLKNSSYLIGRRLKRRGLSWSSFAVDHALPISLSDCERSFSSAKFTLNPLRACMKSDLFEALETLRAWYLQKQQDSQKEKEEVEMREELEVLSEAFKAYSVDNNAEC